MNKKEFKRFFLRLGGQRGFGFTLAVIGATFLVGGLMTAGYSIKARGEKMRVYTENIHRYSSIEKKYDPKTDPNEATLIYKKEMLEAAAKDAGPTAVTSTYGGDDMGIVSTVIQSTGILNIYGEKDDRKENKKKVIDEISDGSPGVIVGVMAGIDEDKRDTEIKKQLDENGISSDRLTIDITKRISDVYGENARCASQEDLKKIEKFAIDAIKQKESQDQQISGEKSSQELLDQIRQDLNSEGMLEDQRIIDKKVSLNKKIQEKINASQRIDDLDKYSNITGHAVSAGDAYRILNAQMDEVDSAIDDIYDELQDNQVIIDGEPKINEDEQDTEEIVGEIVQADDINNEGSEETGESESIEDGDLIAEETGETGNEESEGEEAAQEEEKKGYITLSGTIAGGKGTVSMNINLDTGSITGNFTYSDKAGDCDVRVSAGIYGNMDLETRQISTSVSGTSYYSGEEDYCDTTMAFSDSLNGRLSQDHSSASGQCAHGENWYIYK